MKPPTGCSGSRALRTRPDATRRSPGNSRGTYTNQEESLDQARRNANNDVSDRAAQVLLKGAAEIQRTGWPVRGAEPEQEHAEIYSPRSNDSVAGDVWQGAFRAVECERQKAEARGEGRLPQ